MRQPYRGKRRGPNCPGSGGRIISFNQVIQVPAETKLCMRSRRSSGIGTERNPSLETMQTVQVARSRSASPTLPISARLIELRPRRVGNLTVAEVEEALLTGRILEQYEDTGRGESCLVAGFSDKGKPIHMVCGRRSDWLAIVTVYIPIPPKFKSPYERG